MLGEIIQLNQMFKTKEFSSIVPRLHNNHVIYAYEARAAGGGKKGGGGKSAAVVAFVPGEQDAVTGLLEYFGVEDVTVEQHYSSLLNSQKPENVDKLDSRAYCLLSFIYKSIVLLKKLNKMTDEEELEVR